jgi:cell division GTPase FtsZ
MYMKLVEIIMNFLDLTTRGGIQNIDFRDFYNLLRESGLGHIGIGEGENLLEALHEAERDQLLDVDYTNARACLMNITGNAGLRECGQVIKNFTNDRGIKRFRFGLRDSSGPIRCMVAVGGVRSPYLESFLGAKMEYLE